MSEESPQDPPTRDDAQDAPSAAHTELGSEHPAGEGPRSDRDVGGPTPESPAEDVEGGHGTRESGFEPHK